MKFSIYPDIAVFAKAFGNRCPMATVIGTSGAMEGAYKSFISNTNWTEAIGLTAALTTIKKMSKTDVSSHIEKIGLHVKDFLGKYGNKYNFALKIEKNYACPANFSFEGNLSNKL